MTPKEYLDRYTTLSFTDPTTGFPVSVNVNGYGSGWGPEPGCNRTDVGPKCSKEYNTFFVAALRVAHHGHNTPIGASKFFFDQNQVANFKPTEDFYVSSFINTFVGKGSPDEICDTLRVALAIGRIGYSPDAAGHMAARSSLQKYVDDFITLDCNGLTGNYIGIDPNVSPKQYAVPARRRLSVWDVATGDVAVTVRDSDSACEHIALIEEWTPFGDSGDVNIRIVEWGASGGESAHYTGDAGRVISAKRGDNGQFGIGFSTEGKKFRYVFAPPAGEGSRGW